jgi:hypothetical protein
MRAVMTKLYYHRIIITVIIIHTYIHSRNNNKQRQTKYKKASLLEERGISSTSFAVDDAYNTEKISKATDKDLLGKTIARNRHGSLGRVATTTTIALLA